MPAGEQPEEFDPGVTGSTNNSDFNHAGNLEKTLMARIAMVAYQTKKPPGISGRLVAMRTVTSLALRELLAPPRLVQTDILRSSFCEAEAQEAENCNLVRFPAICFPATDKSAA